MRTTHLRSIFGLLFLILATPALADCDGTPHALGAENAYYGASLDPGDCERFSVHVPSMGILSLAITTPIDGPQSRVSLTAGSTFFVLPIETLRETITIFATRSTDVSFDVTADATIAGFRVTTSFVALPLPLGPLEIRVLDPLATFPYNLPPDPIGVTLMATNDFDENETNDIDVDVVLANLVNDDNHLIARVDAPGVMRIRPTFASGAPTTPVEILVPVKPGRYTVSINDPDVESLGFQLLDFCSSAPLGADESPACARALTVHKINEGLIGNVLPADIDYFALDASMFEQWSITAWDKLDTVGALYDQHGERVALDHDGNGLGFEIVKSFGPGQFYVRVEGELGDFGPYTLTLQRD